jgi:uncharacterized DUF497 family protein
LDYAWDEAKRLSNAEKHGLDFRDAPIVLEAEHIVLHAAKSSGQEARSLATGVLEGIFVTIIFTMRGSVTRIISMRKARHEEKRRYGDLFGS